MVIESLRARFAAAVLAAIVPACSADDSPEKAGTAPIIADLSYTPSSVKVGEQSVIQGRLAFEDVEADVTELAVELKSSAAGAAQAMPRQKTNATGLAKGELQLVLAVAAPAAGDYEFSVYLVDAQGHESNRLSGTLHAE